MAWLALTYSLPSKGSSNPRVGAWRRLQRLGAVALPGGVYLLPDRPDALENFGWLAQEIRHAGGEALVMHVRAFEGPTDADVVGYFHNARRPEYAEVAGQLDELLATLPGGLSREARLGARDALSRLRKRYGEVLKRDFFGTPEGDAVAAKLAQLGTRLAGSDLPAAAVEPVDPASFIGKVWVTRPRPFVDRLASVWLIRRFIDAGAVIHYRDLPEAGEVAFDLPDARFRHVGNLCTFEVLVAAFRLAAPGLRALAETVHDLDLQDGRYGRLEAAGLGAVLSGWRNLPLSDGELEARGVALFEGLYLSLAAEAPPSPADAQADPRAEPTAEPRVDPKENASGRSR